MPYCSSCGQFMELGHDCVALPTAEVRTDCPAELAGLGARAGGYLIDAIPLFVAGLMVGWIPIAGAIIYALFAIPYWLLKDITGRSLGKKLTGTRVVSQRRCEASTGAKILRNLPLAVPAFFLLVPLAGPPVAMVLGGITMLVETVALMTRRRRTGDMVAGTLVVRA